jgi:hypothetical protein
MGKPGRGLGLPALDEPELNRGFRASSEQLGQSSRIGWRDSRQEQRSGDDDD